jgi:hypothetical protein
LTAGYAFAPPSRAMRLLGAAMTAVVALWAPALIRNDRRSVFSLLTSTHLRVEVPVKHTEPA